MVTEVEPVANFSEAEAYPPAILAPSLFRNSERLKNPLNYVQGTVVTEVEPVANFSEAEAYHQQYLARGGRFNQPQSPEKGCDDPVRCYG